MLDRLKALVGGYRVIVVLGLCGIALLGCSGKERQVSKGQVIAHIGEQEVTIQELENEMRWANVPADKQKDPAVVKQVLSELVLRKYLAQRAVNSKLDREPSVLLDILRSREVVLATASVSRAVAAKPITQADIDKYIADNPLKFASRQLVTADEIVFPFGPAAQAAVDASKDANSLDEVDQKLTVMGVPHSRAVGSFNSGEMSQDFFNAIQAKKADNVFFVRSGPNGVFFKVRGEEASPLQGAAAASAARQHIQADRLKAETGMASVSANLDAKYEGDFAKMMSEPGSAPAGKVD